MSIFDPAGNVRPGRILAYLGLLVLAAVTISWGVRVYDTGTAQARGTLSIQAQRNGHDNRIRWSTFFTQKYQNIQADQSNIQIDAEALARPGATQQDAITLSGTQQACTQDVADWNAALDNVLAVVPTQYPQNHLNPDTVCATKPDETGFLNP